ncbi:MAG: type II toxin-antitoxin system prevent-host-death family antitoxin [Notoacmeibacter sp.]|nr:type II toxin-antitoxin system prevent-host-death family antitoxin [Notoacmeibacter sp.]
MTTVRKEFTASEARGKFSEVFDAAFHEGPVIIRKHSKSVAMVRLELLEALAELEAQIDEERAESALSEFLREGGTKMSDLKKELGID